MKVVSPDKKCVELDGITGRNYKAKDGIYDMHPADAKATVAYGGFIPSLMTIDGPMRGVGYRCQGCGFGSYFTTCSRCGGRAVREVS